MHSMDLVITARHAATVAENLLGGAEMLWLQWQMLEGVEEDMGLSANIAKRAASSPGRLYLQQQQQEDEDWEAQHPGLSERNKLFEALVRQFNANEAAAKMQTSLGDLVATAAAMKGTSIGLSSHVSEDQQAAVRRFSL